MKKAAVFAASAAGLYGVFAGELYRYVFCREGSPVLSRFLDKKGHAEDYYQHRDSAAEALRGKPQLRFDSISPRGETLRGFYFPGTGNGKRIAFIVHGYRSDHADTAGMYYDYYMSRGFDLFCCDNTASGESGGRHIGFDFFETEDCLHWLDFLRWRFGEDIQIILHGFSMGGATVLKMSSRCPDNVKFIVSDSGYADGTALLNGQLKAMYTPMLLLNRLIAGYSISQTDVRESLSQARLPILFVHGREDTTVPFAHGPGLYGMYQGKKDFLFPAGAKHVESMHNSPAAYEAKLDAFIRDYIRK